MDTIRVKEAVREKYSEAARRVASGSASCCGAPSAASRCDAITSNLYANAEKDALPDTAVLASLGCGNPTALAQLSAGETVLDLGSGEASTSCCRHGASVRQEWPMGST